MLPICWGKIVQAKILLSYFGEHLTKDCGNCDVCDNPTAKTLTGTVFWLRKHFLQIARMKEKEGITMFDQCIGEALIMRRYMLAAFPKLKTYAWKRGKFYWLARYIIQLANQGWSEIMYRRKVRPKISPIGWNVLKGEQANKNWLWPVVFWNAKNKNEANLHENGRWGRSDTDLFTGSEAGWGIRFPRRKFPSLFLFQWQNHVKEMAVIMPCHRKSVLGYFRCGDEQDGKYGEEFMAGDSQI